MTSLEAGKPQIQAPVVLRKRKLTPLEERQAKQARIAWYLYDFGNSAYASVVLLAVYSAYFQGTVVGGPRGSWLWGLSVGIAMLVVAISSPILGAIADFAGAKKRFLFFFTALSIAFTGMLFFVQKGDIVTGMLFFILAEIGYRAAQVFYDALLPEIAAPDEMSKVSGNGWAIGSAGGFVSLLIVLALILTFKGEFIVRLSMVVTAAFFALSALPLFLLVKEKAVPQPLPPGQNHLTVASQRLRYTFTSVKQFKPFVRFIIAFLIYNDGIIMLLDFAAIIGAVLFGLTQQQLIIVMLIVQVTSVGGAYLFGLVSDRLNSKNALVISLLMLIAIVIVQIFAQSVVLFYILAALAGFALTGVQSVSRTAVGLMCPEGKSAEFYGMFAVAGRTSSFIGPTVYGWLAANAAYWFHEMGYPAKLAEQSGQRVAIASIAVFLLVGLGLLMAIKKTYFEPVREIAD
ncbi:MAG: MFS transporter [Anaerolineae bacterium]|nr:MFS transporter [Anaerolineae bacterium]